MDECSWQLNKDVKICVDWAALLQSDTRRSYLEVLAYYAENYSADHAYNMNVRASAFFNYSRGSDINVNSLISYRSTLNKSTEHYLGAFRGFLRRWYDLGYTGVDKNVIALLSGWRLKGNEKGRAVSLMDEDSGPYTDIEMSAILEGLLSGYTNKKISLSDYALVSTLAYSGRRAIQIVSLKLKDLVKSENNGIMHYGICFPRAKQRGRGWRKDFNVYPIVEDLWHLLNLQKEKVVDQAQLLFSSKISQSIIHELPLFPNFDAFQNVSEEELKIRLPFDFYHAKRTSCSEALKRCSPVIKAYSERTDKKIILRATRFRYTLGSNLAREGRGEYIIAEALDHSDIQNVGVYVRNIPDVVERIDRAVAKQLAPLAQAFQGVLVKSEQDAIRGADKSSRISNGQKNVGTCGSYGFCSALAPLACYTCAYFQPWLDGPHELVLKDLLFRRDEVADTTGDFKIAAVNDRLILAVGEVIKLCDESKLRTRELNNATR